MSQSEKGNIGFINFRRDKRDMLPRLVTSVSNKMVHVMAKILVQSLSKKYDETNKLGIRIAMSSPDEYAQRVHDIKTIFSMEYKEQIFKAWELIIQNNRDDFTTTHLDYPSNLVNRVDVVHKQKIGVIVKNIREKNYSQLGLLSARLDVMNPYLVVTRKNNPLDPVTLIRAIRNTLQEMDVTSEGSIYFYELFEKNCTNQLHQVYQKLNSFLASKGYLSGISPCIKKNNRLLFMSGDGEINFSSIISRYKDSVVDKKIFKNIAKKFTVPPCEEKNYNLNTEERLADVANSFYKVFSTTSVPDTFKLKVARLQIPIVRQILNCDEKDERLDEIICCIEKLTFLLLNQDDNAKLATQTNIILKFFASNIDTRKSIFKETISRIEYLLKRKMEATSKACA